MATGGLSPSTAPSWEILHPVPLQGTGGTHTLASATCLHVGPLKICRYHKNLGVKDGGWGLLKGVIFSGACDTYGSVLHNVEFSFPGTTLSYICSCMEVLWTLQPHCRSWDERWSARWNERSEKGSLTHVAHNIWSLGAWSCMHAYTYNVHVLTVDNLNNVVVGEGGKSWWPKFGIKFQIPYFLDFFPRVLLISVPPRMQDLFEGGKKSRQYGRFCLWISYFHFSSVYSYWHQLAPMICTLMNTETSSWSAGPSSTAVVMNTRG